MRKRRLWSVGSCVGRSDGENWLILGRNVPIEMFEREGYRDFILNDLYESLLDLVGQAVDEGCVVVGPVQLREGRDALIAEPLIDPSLSYVGVSFRIRLARTWGGYKTTVMHLDGTTSEAAVIQSEWLEHPLLSSHGWADYRPERKTSV